MVHVPSSVIGQSYVIPDTLRNWPWKRILNPHYHKAKTESEEWLAKFNAFTPKSQYIFDRCDGSLLASLSFPQSSLDSLRSCCELMHTFYLIDDYTDKADVDGAKKVCNTAIKAIEQPESLGPNDHALIGEIALQFWQRAKVHAAKVTQERFIATWRTYLESVITQAERRGASYICTIDEYMDARRDNIGTRPSFAFMEICLGLNIPHIVMEHPALVTLERCATDLVLLGNDILSYKWETLAAAADYNIVTVVMLSKKTDLSGAIEWISSFHDEIVDQFLRTAEDVREHRNGVPSWGHDLDQQVSAYINGLGQWVRANTEWSFESGRYFGDKGLEIKKSRLVVIQ